MYKGLLHDKIGPEKCVFFSANLFRVTKVYSFLQKTKTCQFKAFPFGVNITPMIFTRLIKPVADLLGKQDVHLIIYLGDLLIMGTSGEEDTLFTTTAMWLLASLGFTLTNEKFILFC